MRQVRRVAWLIDADRGSRLAIAFIPLATFGAGLPLGNASRLRGRAARRQRPRGPVAGDHAGAGDRRCAGSRERGAVIKRLSAVETLGSTERDLHRQDRDADREPHARHASSGPRRAKLDQRTARDDGGPSNCARRGTRALASGDGCVQQRAARRRGMRRGDPTEVAMLRTASGARRRCRRDRRANARRRRQFHFDPTLKLMSTHRRARRGDMGRREGCTGGAAATLRDGRSDATIVSGRSTTSERARDRGDGRRATPPKACACSASRSDGCNRRAAYPNARARPSATSCFLGLVAMLDPPADGGRGRGRATATRPASGSSS